MKRDDNVDERDPLASDPNCQYSKVKSLSAGAFGFVQHARHKATGRDVAIKFMQRGSEGMKKYVEYELLNHRTLRHPHVIQFKEVFLTPEYICIVMEYASGGSLFNHVQKAGALREPTARWFFQQLMVGLDYCHRKGVVNRDIKLENTLLKNVPNLPLPLVKICDFGYSKDHLTSDPKSKVGTIAYMAPEVVALEDSSKYDGKLADIWSCGVMLYVMLCGRYPFDIHKGCIADPTKVNWKVPDGVELSPECLDLLNHMLVKDPAERLTMDGIMRHPWFRTNLPEKALRMNDGLVGKEDYTGVQSIEDIRAVLREAQQCPANPQLGNDAMMTDHDQDLLIDAAIDNEMMENEQSFDVRPQQHGMPMRR